MKQLLPRLGAALLVSTFGAMATAETPAVGSKPSVTPKTGAPKAPNLSGAKLKPTAPQLHPVGACGIGQTQCFLGGGKVPSSIAAGSPDNARPKTCVFNADPQWSCGTCERCVLYKTEGAFCGPKGCDYKKCQPNFADLDGNRKNGCETWVPIKKPVPPRQPPANLPAKACTNDSECGTASPDIRCVKRHPGVAQGTCGWWRCRPSTNDCNYLPYSGNTLEGAPACLNNAESDGHGCGYSYPSCRRFGVPTDGGLCRTDMSVVDADGDGYPSIALLVGPDGVSDGNDCDDGDPARFPGNTEVCDAYSHDEDCDPSTNGAADADHDGQLDAACCNVLASGAKSCGTDCDDKNPALALAAKRCAANGQMELCTVDSSGGGRTASWVTRACGAGSVCVAQPDGSGVCQLH
ncbi:MAG TPA: putative metal-binding motif-containing protein [Polyangiaceae bacterium]|nr:putative metal-binding motif-containing protein [Polyangiaceae bacterium]